MSDTSKKRTNSFRKLFPQLFFSQRSKEKTTVGKDLKNQKSNPEHSLISNQYQNPQTVTAKATQVNETSDENIYENLTASHRIFSENDNYSQDIPSNHSSSSTLVSESVKNKLIVENDVNEIVNYREIDCRYYNAKPQVPRKPQSEIIHSKMSDNSIVDSFKTPQYPDVYYHSLEKLTGKITPLDEIDIYRASKVHADPAPVGAEIKKVSTRFLISPKKEAEVRTIQPNRARSLSLDKNNDRSRNRNTDKDIFNEIIIKPYNYSAPTSPMPIIHKIPNMPKMVSPYEHVRKTMMEAEEKRNSLSRSSQRNKSSPSPRQLDQNEVRSVQPHKDNVKVDNVAVEKEKTRQKVEAFYWQKLKEQKLKEDEFLLRQSMRSPMHGHNNTTYNMTYSNSSCSSPNSFIIEPRSYSLPRGKELTNYITNQTIYSKSPFVRNAPERRTDSFIKGRSEFYGEQDIIYRHPEKLFIKDSVLSIVEDKKPVVILNRGTLSQETRDINQQTKRVSFEEQYLNNATVQVNDAIKKLSTDSKEANECVKTINSQVEYSPNALKIRSGSRGSSSIPPKPPVRTTSVNSVGKNNKVINNNKKNNSQFGGQIIYSESESGSEASEIQRILQNNSRKAE